MSNRVINKRQVIETIAASLIAIILAAFIRIVFFQTYSIENNSMEPTFSDGDRVLAVKYIKTFFKINHGDIIVFKQNTSGVNLVKRVIGIPSDKIEIKDGNLFINENLLNTNQYKFSNDFEMVITLENGNFFVLGDNLSDSVDSRDFGMVKENSILAKVFLIFNPRNHFRFLKRD